MVEIQLHLPAELHQELIRLQLDPSQLLQDAIHQATGRDRRRAAAHEFLDWMDENEPPLSAEEIADGEAWLETILSTKNR